MKHYAYFFLIILLVSCESKVNYKAPDDLISKEQMIDILFDMHLAVGSVNVNNNHLEKNRNYMSLVYEKYRIDSVKFAESNLYYVSKAKEYEEIFEEVEKRLEALRDDQKDAIDSIMESYKNKEKPPNVDDRKREIDKVKY